MRVSSRCPQALLICLLTLAALASSGCSRSGAPQPAAEEAGPVRVGPENIARVSREVIRMGPRLSGSLEPRNQARVRAEVSGAAVWVSLELGKRVKKGQVLVRIDNTTLLKPVNSAKSALAAARMQLENATRQLERARRLFQTGALAKQEVEAAESARTEAASQVAAAQSQLTQAREQLKSATVEAPMDGVISEKAVSQGDVVAVGGPLFTVIDPTSMRLEASVPSDALSVLQAGTRVDFNVRGFPNETFQGRIEQVAPAVDPQTRQITTLIAIPNPGGRLLAGLFAEGRIGATSKETLVAPLAAIDMAVHPPSVLRVQGGKVARVSVKLGLQDPQTEQVELIGPVHEGDILLTGAAKDIAPGTPVTLPAAQQAAVR